MVEKIKKILCTTLATVTMISGIGLSSQVVQAKEPIKVMVNGEYVVFDEQPILENGSVFVPMRAIFEALDFEVRWDNQFQLVLADDIEDYYLVSVRLYSGNKMDIGYTEYTKAETYITNHTTNRNSKDFSTNFTNKVTLNPPYQSINGRILVPVRAIGEGSGATVKWDGATQTVIIDSSDKVITNISTGESFDVNNAKSRVESYFGDSSQSSGNSQGTTQPTVTEKTEEELTAEYFGTGQATLEEHQAEVLRLINIERENAGVPPLEADPLLMEIAQLKAEEMETLGYFDHNSPNYGTPQKFAEHYGYNGKIGENILRGTGVYTPSAAVGMLMQSESHRENILNPNYKYIGVGRAGSFGGSVGGELHIGLAVQTFSY